MINFLFKKKYLISMQCLNRMGKIRIATIKINKALKTQKRIQVDFLELKLTINQQIKIARLKSYKKITIIKLKLKINLRMKKL